MFCEGTRGAGENVAETERRGKGREERKAGDENGQASKGILLS